jgi:hypothetical protein
VLEREREIGRHLGRSTQSVEGSVQDQSGVLKLGDIVQSLRVGKDLVHQLLQLSESPLTVLMGRRAR